jgi:hypothetical protein
MDQESRWILHVSPSQCYISTAVWLILLFLYFHNMQCGEVWQLVLIFMER